MKKRNIVLVILVCFVLVCMTGCGCSSTSSDESSSSSSQYTDNDEMSTSEIEMAIYQAVKEYDYGKSDPASTRYNINKRTGSGENEIVYGTLSLYDEYGKLVKSGLSFEVKNRLSGMPECKIITK